jgi:hypothetical protein
LTPALSHALEERWAQYIRLREQQAHYAAFVRLAEIANCLRYGKLSPQIRLKWTQRVAQPDLTQEIIKSIEVEAQNGMDRIQRIVGTGALIEDEALLVITLGVQLEVLLVYLKERGARSSLDLGRVDALLQTMASEPENLAVYRSALRAAKQNWGLPLQSKWLSSLHY